MLLNRRHLRRLLANSLISIEFGRNWASARTQRNLQSGKGSEVGGLHRCTSIAVESDVSALPIASEYKTTALGGRGPQRVHGELLRVARKRSMVGAEGFEPPGFLLPNESRSFHGLHGFPWIPISYMESGRLLSLNCRSRLTSTAWGFDTV
jgi:hypothetical protein